MQRFVFALVLLPELVCSACGSAGLERAIPTPTPMMAKHYIARLMQLNHSGVSGTVDFQLSGNVLVVTMNVTSLAPNQKHFQHIHGDGTSSCPSAAEASGDVTLSEALTNIGPLAFDLQPYPVTDSQGRLDGKQTFTLEPDELANITPMTGHVMVLHGTINSQGTYDRYLPAACGDIEAS
jgi:hypothetical protein